MADNEEGRAFNDWFEGLQTLDEMFNLLESAEGRENKGQGPGSADNED